MDQDLHVTLYLFYIRRNQRIDQMLQSYNKNCIELKHFTVVPIRGVRGHMENL